MRREEESTAADNWEEREGGGTGRRTSFQEHVRVGRCPPMVDPHAGGSAQRASEGRALLLREAPTVKEEVHAAFLFHKNE